MAYSTFDGKQLDPCSGGCIVRLCPDTGPRDRAIESVEKAKDCAEVSPKMRNQQGHCAKLVGQRSWVFHCPLLDLPQPFFYSVNHNSNGDGDEPNYHHSCDQVSIIAKYSCKAERE